MILERHSIFNNIDETIEFTMEKASEENLSFLDCIISWTEKIEIITKVYIKPTHTDQYTHFSSNQTSSNEEISYFRKTMQLNGYPVSVINKTIKDIL